MSPRILPILAALALAVPAFAAPATPTTAPAAPRRPNILFLLTDDQRWDSLGVVQRELGPQARYPFFKTPNLDRIATGGARLRNAFVVQSLCSPSRATMLSGQPSHETGIRDNRTAFHSEHTWAAALRDAGYRTAFFGKWHMGKQEDRPGFTDTFTFVDQGIYPNCRFLENGKWVETHGWVDDVTTDHAIAYMRTHRAEPFVLYLGFKSSHDPRQPAPRHLHDYEDVNTPPPPNFHATPPFRPEADKKVWHPAAPDRLNYFRCLAGVDDDVGRILDTLDELGLAQDTVVIFAGDNGYYLGEHGLGDKRTAYEDSMRIPVLVRYPRLIKPGTLIDPITLNLDVAATILDFAHVTPTGWNPEGRSWVPLLRGDKVTDWRHAFHYENYQDPEYADVTFDIQAVRTDAAKLVTYPGHPDWTQVFDLTADPLEEHNLVNDPAAHELTAGLGLRLANYLAGQKD